MVVSGETSRDLTGGKTTQDDSAVPNRQRASVEGQGMRGRGSLSHLHAARQLLELVTAWARRRENLVDGEL